MSVIKPYDEADEVARRIAADEFPGAEGEAIVTGYTVNEIAELIAKGIRQAAPNFEGSSR